MKTEIIARVVGSILMNAAVPAQDTGQSEIDLAKLPDLGASAALWEIAFQLSVMNDRAEREQAMQAGASLFKH